MEQLQNIIQEITAAGAQYADIYIQSGEGHSVSFDNGRIEGIASTTNDGTAVRIIRNNQSFMAHAPGINAIASLASDCSANAGIGRNFPAIKETNFYVGEVLSQPEHDFFHALDEMVKRESKYIKQSTFRYFVSKKNIAVISPSGVTLDSRYYTSFTAQVVAERGGILQQGYERRCRTLPAGQFWHDGSCEEIALAAARRALLMLAAEPCPAGVMNVLLDGEAGGTIIHEACGHGLEADIVEKDKSVYNGQIGQQVAAECVTIADDPLMDTTLYGSYKFDDEGTPAQKTVLIENGILKGYLTDVLSSQMYDLPRTGNGRRESYNQLPIPRMSNTYLAKGTETFSDLLARAENGFYVKKMGGGEVDPTSGDFVFYVSEGYKIEHGSIGTPVRGAILTGNGPEVLCKIKGLGTNIIMDPGLCGKSGQNVPVTDGQPTMLIEGMTVGGSSVVR